MDTLLIHLLKSHLLMAIFYLIYRLLVSRRPWFQMNRLILLILPTLALIIPFLKLEIGNPFDPAVVMELAFVQLPVFEIGTSPTSVSGIKWWFIGGWFYVAVAAILVVLMSSRLIRILLLPGSQSESYTITNIQGSSFSFFNKICIDETLDSETREMVLKHEQVHADQLHSADAVFYEILSCLLWCNPAVWKMKKELRDTHEFIADHAMKDFFPHHDYLNALLNATFNTRSIQFLPMFNNSQTLLKRVTMMNIKQTKTQRLSYLIVLPLVAVIAFAFACTDKKEQLSPSSAEHLEVKEEPLSIVDQMPEFPGGQQALFTYLGESINYPETAKRDSISGVVYISFVIEKDGAVNEVEVKKGIGSGCDEEARRVISGMPDWIPGIHDGENVRVVYNLPIRFSLKS